MTNHLIMSDQDRKALEAALTKRYPNEGSPSISLSKKDPWSGTAKYHHAFGTNTAIFTFKMNGNNGLPNLYIERDWND